MTPDEKLPDAATSELGDTTNETATTNDSAVNVAPQEVSATQQTAEEQNASVGDDDVDDDVAKESITDDELRQERTLEARGSETRTCTIELDGDRIEELEHEQSEEVHKWLDLEAQKSAMASEYSAKIKPHKSRVQKIHATLKAGKEEMPIECTWYYDWLNGMRHLVRSDDGDTVESRVIGYDELKRWRDAQEPQLFDEASGEEKVEEEDNTLLYEKIKCNVCGWIHQLEWEEGVAVVPAGMVCGHDGCVSTALSLHGGAFTPDGDFVGGVDERRCKDCGCTEGNACIDEASGETCSWYSEDLCTHCAQQRSDYGEPTNDGDDPEKHDPDPDDIPGSPAEDLERERFEPIEDITIDMDDDPYTAMGAAADAAHAEDNADA